MIPMMFGNMLKTVTKIRRHEFKSVHCDAVRRVRYESGNLVLPHRGWLAKFLGAGEEKAVYCICDDSDRVFALELIDEPHYLNGRLVGGEYFCQTRASIHNVKADPTSMFGLTFTGLVKAREYIHGYEWAFPVRCTASHCCRWPTDELVAVIPQSSVRGVPTGVYGCPRQKCDVRDQTLRSAGDSRAIEKRGRES